MLSETIEVEIEAILKELVVKADFTSAWLCEFDFARKLSIVRAGYAKNKDNLLERESDVGEEFPEFDPEFIAWLLNHHVRRPILHVDEMERDDPEFFNYVENGADSVGFVHVIVDTKTWGFIEFWESRQKREFSDEDFDVAQNFASQIAAVIKQTRLETP